MRLVESYIPSIDANHHLAADPPRVFRLGPSLLVSGWRVYAMPSREVRSDLSVVGAVLVDGKHRATIVAPRFDTLSRYDPIWLPSRSGALAYWRRDSSTAVAGVRIAGDGSVTDAFGPVSVRDLFWDHAIVSTAASPDRSTSVVISSRDTRGSSDGLAMFVDRGSGPPVLRDVPGVPNGVYTGATWNGDAVTIAVVGGGQGRPGTPTRNPASVFTVALTGQLVHREVQLVDGRTRKAHYITATTASDGTLHVAMLTDGNHADSIVVHSSVDGGRRWKRTGAFPVAQWADSPVLVPLPDSGRVVLAYRRYAPVAGELEYSVFDGAQWTAAQKLAGIVTDTQISAVPLDSSTFVLAWGNASTPTYPTPATTLGTFHVGCR